MSTSVWVASRPVTFTLTFAGVGERSLLLDTGGGQRATRPTRLVGNLLVARVQRGCINLKAA